MNRSFIRIVWLIVGGLNIMAPMFTSATPEQEFRYNLLGVLWLIGGSIPWHGDPRE
jgi:hypothetical protein